MEHGDAEFTETDAENYLVRASGQACHCRHVILIELQDRATFARVSGGVPANLHSFNSPRLPLRSPNLRVAFSSMHARKKRGRCSPMHQPPNAGCPTVRSKTRSLSGVIGPTPRCALHFFVTWRKVRSRKRVVGPIFSARGFALTSHDIHRMAGRKSSPHRYNLRTHDHSARTIGFYCSACRQARSGRRQRFHRSRVWRARYH